MGFHSQPCARWRNWEVPLPHQAHEKATGKCPSLYKMAKLSWSLPWYLYLEVSIHPLEYQVAPKWRLLGNARKKAATDMMRMPDTFYEGKRKTDD